LQDDLVCKEEELKADDPKAKLFLENGGRGRGG
jgi:hypothetical protein